MGIYYEHITDDLKGFILAQKMFFVGTAPNSEDEVHISPKGYDEKTVKQFFEVQIHRLTTTCGFGVPIMEYEKG